MGKTFKDGKLEKDRKGFRNKEEFNSGAYRKLKHIPYGSQGWQGIGGEVYIGKNEIMTNIVSKRKERTNWKKDLNYED